MGENFKKLQLATKTMGVGQMSTEVVEVGVFRTYDEAKQFRDELNAKIPAEAPKMTPRAKIFALVYEDDSEFVVGKRYVDVLECVIAHKKIGLVPYEEPKKTKEPKAQKPEPEVFVWDDETGEMVSPTEKAA